MDDSLNSGFHAGGKKAYLDNLLLQQFNELRKLKRDGKLTPVLIDFGFTNNVRSHYYAR